MRQGEWGVWYEGVAHGCPVSGWLPTWDGWEEYSGTEQQCRDKAELMNQGHPHIRHVARRLPKVGA